jgi:hypothetical protein
VFVPFFPLSLDPLCSYFSKGGKRGGKGDRRIYEPDRHFTYILTTLALTNWKRGKGDRRIYEPDRHFTYRPTTLALTNLSNFGNSRSNHPFPSSKIFSCFPALIPPPDVSPYPE